MTTGGVNVIPIILTVYIVQTIMDNVIRPVEDALVHKL